MSESFAGMNDFIWFIGVVESRDDPLKAGRLQVRILGHHTPNKNDLATADLMWASPMLSLTDGGISGIGNSPTWTPEGTHVMGYFRDGMDRQEPVILGVLPGVVKEFGNPDVGFYDPNTGDGTSSKYPKHLGSDVNQLARNDPDDQHIHTQIKTASRIQGIALASFGVAPLFQGQVVPAVPATSWDEPAYTHNSKYPFNHVMETESGHITEYDDTPDYERIHLYHRAGTSIEMINTPGGSGEQSRLGERIDKTVGDYYSSKDRNSQEIIQFHKEETIGGHYKLLVNQQGIPNQHFTIQVGAGSNINLQIDNGSLNMFATTGMNFVTGGNFDITCLNYQLTTLGSKVENINGSSSEFVIGPNTKTGNPLNLN